VRHYQLGFTIVFHTYHILAWLLLASAQLGTILDDVSSAPIALRISPLGEAAWNESNLFRLGWLCDINEADSVEHSDNGD
jgi:hypothetical protein